MMARGRRRGGGPHVAQGRAATGVSVDGAAAPARCV